MGTRSVELLLGILVVSNVWKTPTYNMILAGGPEALPADWEATRQRYFTINWLQLATTWGGVRALSRGPRGAVAGPQSRCCT